MAAVARFTPTIAFLGILALAGCEEGVGPFAAQEPEEASVTLSASPEPTFEERDVEAPDVFGATESGLWDGRPSLGGVWVAHPEVATPERVQIRNEATGKTVVGALFRRERENPGPRFQISSDAASALGILAGQPTMLDVVALRREIIEIPAEIDSDMDAPDLDESDQAVVADMIDTAPEEAGAVDALAADLPEETTEAPKRRSGLFGFLRRNRAPSTPEPAPETGEISATALDPIAATAGAAIEAAEESGNIAAGAAEVAAVATATDPEPAEQTSRLRQPFVQIGIFSVEENADETASRLRSEGLIPTVREESSASGSIWRVVIGPAMTSRDRRAILSKVRDLGFEDAYFVKN